MTLIPLRPFMEASVKHGFAQDTFNVNAVTRAKAAIGVHEMFYSTAILQGTSLASDFMGGRYDFTSATLGDKKKDVKNIARTVKKCGEDSSTPIILHLDRGRDFDFCATVIAGGYTTATINGSSLAFDENVEPTREVIKYTYARGVSMEGELGVLAGAENHMFSEGFTYTNPLKAVESFRKTGVDVLTIFYGTMHGASKGKDVKLHERIAVAIRECLNYGGILGALIPHGLSAVPEYIVNEINELEGTPTGAYGIVIHGPQVAARCSIDRINTDTGIRLAVTRNMREFFVKNPDKRNSSSIGGTYELSEPRREQLDPRAFLIPIVDAVVTGVISDENTAAITDRAERGMKGVMGTLIAQFGSHDKAPLAGQVSLEEMVECYRKMQI